MNREINIPIIFIGYYNIIITIRLGMINVITQFDEQQGYFVMMPLNVLSLKNKKPNEYNAN